MTAASTYVHTLWCDDIRHEMGNKQSVMGIYPVDIVVAELPAVLQRLASLTHLVTPIELPPCPVMLRLLIDDVVIFEQQQELQPELPELAARGYTRKTMLFGVTLAPLALPAGCKYLQMTVRLGDEPALEGNKLWITVDSRLLNGAPVPEVPPDQVEPTTN